MPLTLAVVLPEILSETPTNSRAFVPESSVPETVMLGATPVNLALFSLVELKANLPPRRKSQGECEQHNKQFGKAGESARESQFRQPARHTAGKTCKCTPYTVASRGRCAKLHDARDTIRILFPGDNFSQDLLGANNAISL